MATGISSFDSSLNKTIAFLHDVRSNLALDDNEQAYKASRAVLHALRDRLTVEEAAQLAAQLPMIIRGYYYEGWHPAGKPVKMRTLQEFLDYVHKKMGTQQTPKLSDPNRLSRGVFAALAKHVTKGEIQSIIDLMPAEIRPLFSSQEQ
ncbi:DUF2267 domain-containing protein [Oceanidesulfovibrio indonesiensis]|uniref:DUF2267 domain-containing protein n=1 Tax=Oceanidesulfovibrio indonesiensis TaxID=54767 RepID=A0A7M3MG15_9BACT|nr:DUF2267 domain-containing protein [Oceanidesulfovibrio indonesiensis]TVM18263.1 DUF2267 domain-containing protein [Oceanidesulfovibrio indonesiensis]